MLQLIKISQILLWPILVTMPLLFPAQLELFKQSQLFPQSRIFPQSQLFPQSRIFQQSRIPNSNFEIYVDTAKQFFILYPKYLEPDAVDPHIINFREKNSDGPWLINISVTETASKSVFEWVRSTNKIRSKPMPPLKIVKITEKDGTTLLYLKTPVIIDKTSYGKPIFADQDSAILIKNQQLYQILKRDLWQDYHKPSAFAEIVSNFHLLSLE